MTSIVHTSKRDTGVRSAEARQPIGGSSKRLLDIVIAVLVLASAAVVLAVIALALRVMNSGPIFYGHERIGFAGQRFNCLKFRTMVVDADTALEAHLAENEAARTEYARDRKLRNDPRVIPYVGRFLRRTSLDELPQILNVLRGEMSIVGPRPVTEEEVMLYGACKQDYLSTRPGITGLWQVSGRSSLSFDDRVRLDARYVRRWSLLTDLKILFQTVGVVFAAKDAY